MKVTHGKAALILVALISMAACSSKPDVRYVEVPATDEATTAVEATEPAAPDFTLPIPPTQAPKPIPAPPVVNPGYDTFNDRILDDQEYAVLFQILTDQGYVPVDQDTYEGLGDAFCDVAVTSATFEEFAQTTYDLIVQNGLDPDEVGFTIGALMGVMCQSEMARIGAI